MTAESANGREEGGGPRRECESDRQYAWGVEDCAGGAGRRGRGGGRRAGERRGRPLPLPGSRLVPRAAGLSAPRRDMWPPLGLLAGNGRGGPCRAERCRAPRGERSWVRSGRGVLPYCRRAPSPAVRPGPGGGAAGGVGSGTRAVAGAGVTGIAGPVAMRPGVSSTRDKGRGVEGACSACPRPCALISAPVHSSSVALRRPRVHGRLWRVPGAATGPRSPAPPRATPRLAASWPQCGRWLGAGGPLGLLLWVKGGSPAAPRVPATRRWLPGRAACSGSGRPGPPSCHFSARAWSLGKQSRWRNRRLTSSELRGASGLVDVVTVGCVCVFFFF